MPGGWKPCASPCSFAVCIPLSPTLYIVPALYAIVVDIMVNVSSDVQYLKGLLEKMQNCSMKEVVEE